MSDHRLRMAIGGSQMGKCFTDGVSLDPDLAVRRRKHAKASSNLTKSQDLWPRSQSQKGVDLIAGGFPSDRRPFARPRDSFWAMQTQNPAGGDAQGSKLGGQRPLSLNTQLAGQHAQLVAAKKYALRLVMAMKE